MQGILTRGAREELQAQLASERGESAPQEGASKANNGETAAVLDDGVAAPAASGGERTGNGDGEEGMTKPRGGKKKKGGRQPHRRKPGPKVQ